MIQAKLKICAGCNQSKHIWKSHGKEKYCKECWYSIEKPKSIAPMSKKMKETVDQYSKIRTAYLTINTLCKAKLAGCTANATEVHHKAGRGEKGSGSKGQSPVRVSYKEALNEIFVIQQKQKLY